MNNNKLYTNDSSAIDMNKALRDTLHGKSNIYSWLSLVMMR